MKTKHLIITGQQGSGKTKAAQAVLSLTDPKYTTRLNNKICSIFLGKYSVLPYLRHVLIDDVLDAVQVVELTRLIAMYAPNISIIFVCQQPCFELKKDDRYNIVELG